MPGPIIPVRHVRIRGAPRDMTRVRAALPVVLAILLGGCGGDDAGGIRPHGGTASVDPRAPLPAAKGERVVALRRGGREVALDLATLRGLPQGRLTVREPFRRRTMSFVGVRLGDLLGADRGKGGELHLHALDDYHVEIPLEELGEDDALLAWQADGRRIATAEGGPVRVVYPAGSSLGRNRDNWIWSVEAMRVRR